MSIRNLDSLFDPRSVAVIGASERPFSVGGTLWRNMHGGGFAGAVYPVNPKYATLSGQRCYASLADLPEAPELAVVCTPAATVVDLVKHLGLSQSTVSKHLACLKDTGMVVSRAEGRASMYSLAHPDAVVAILAAAEKMLALTGDAVRLCPQHHQSISAD